jgi:hypothetical protein
MFGDNRFTLTPSCHERVEAEANYAAGQLLFLQVRFVSNAKNLSLGMDAVKTLQGRYKNTITTTLWRYVDLNPSPVVGAINGHPHRPAENFSPRTP